MSKERQLLDQISREQERSSLYLLQYTDSLKPVQNIMVAYGILTGMLSDIIAHELAKGKSEKSKSSLEKVFQLMDIVESFSKIEDHNKACRMNIAGLLNTTVDLENKVIELEKELAGVRKAWEQTV